MSVGAYTGETDIQAGKRRIIVGVFALGVPARLIAALDAFDSGLAAVGVLDLLAAAISLGALIALRFKPGWAVGIFGVVFVSIIVEVLTETIILGGLVTSSVVIVFGLLAVLGALIAFSVGAAFWWMVVRPYWQFVGKLLRRLRHPRYQLRAETAPRPLAVGGIGGGSWPPVRQIGHRWRWVPY